MYLLEVIDGLGQKRQVPLDRPHVLIGREPSCDVHLPHPAVSRRHAQLQQTNQGRWVLQDLSSRNRVYVDNKVVQQTVLEPRQVFRIAEYKLCLLDPAHPGPPPMPSEKAPEAMDETAETGLILEGAWLENLNTFQRAVLSLEDPHQVLEALALEIQRVARPRVLAIGLMGPQGYTWEVVQTQKEDVPLREYLDEADARVAEEPSSLLAWDGSISKGARRTSGTCLLAPLRGRQTMVGHAYLSRDGQEPLSKTQQRYLGLAASYAALAWENLQLGRVRKTNVDFEKELQHARQIQIDLFPHTFDIDPRLDAFAVNLPSARVSGDYYDLIRIGPDAIAFIIADAMGHGMPAALMMAAVRAGLRMGLFLELPWDSTFQGVDDLIRQVRTDTFVTGMVGLLRLDTQELRLVSAGHPPPSILVDGQPVTLPEHCQTRPWGIDLDTQWEVGRLSLRGKRWSILCFTDGLTESATQGQRSFGTRRVAQYHQRHFLQSAEDLGQGLLNEVAAVHGPGPLEDDQTVLVLCSS